MKTLRGMYQWFVVFDRPDKLIGCYNGPKKADDGILAHVEVIEKSEYDALLKITQEQKAKLKIAVKALEEIAKDFGTDHCGGNTMIAKEILDKLKPKWEVIE